MQAQQQNDIYLGHQGAIHDVISMEEEELGTFLVCSELLQIL
jgi:hypothetical protein